jgi:hypothetical protein
MILQNLSKKFINKFTKTYNINNYGFFLVFLVISLCFCFDAIFKGYLTNDTAETLYMGRNLSFYYPKHPFISFWLSHFIENISTHHYLGLWICFFRYCVFSLIIIYSYNFAKLFFSKSENFILFLYTLSLALLFATKPTEFTPDLFFGVFSILYISSTYKLLCNDTNLNRFLSIFYLLLLFFTKFQAIVVFAASSIPFLFSIRGRKILLQYKTILYIAVFLIPLIIYFTYSISNPDQISSIYYGLKQKDSRVFFKIFYKIILGFFWCYNIFAFVLVISNSKVLKSVIFKLKNIKITKSILDNNNEESFKILFLFSNSIIFLIFLIILMIRYKPDGPLRYVFSSAPFISLFVFYYFKESFNLLTKSFKKIIIIFFVIFIFFQLRFIIKSIHKNQQNAVYKEVAKNFEFADNSPNLDDFSHILQSGRQFDKLYLFLSQKKIFIDKVNYSDDQIYKILENKNFIIIWYNQKPDFVNNYIKYFSDLGYKTTPIKTINLQIKRTFNFNSQNISVDGVLFRKP